MRSLLLSLALLLAASAAGAEPLALRRPRPAPARRYLVAGSVLLGVGYLVALGLAVRYEEGELAVPAIGPLVDLRRCRGCAHGPVGQGEIGGLVLDSALQAAGATLLSLAF